MVNRIAGTRRMLGHAVVTPGQPGWMDAVDVAVAKLHPDSWKLYTIGDPLSAKTKFPFRLDDEKLMYPFYDKAVKAGIRTICIHKGLDAGGLREKLGERVAVQHGLGYRQGRQGLAAVELRHLPRLPAGVPGAPRSGAGRV